MYDFNLGNSDFFLGLLAPCAIVYVPHLPFCLQYGSKNELNEF